jgi:hypothetical protein
MTKEAQNEVIRDVKNVLNGGASTVKNAFLNIMQGGTEGIQVLRSWLDKRIEERAAKTAENEKVRTAPESEVTKIPGDTDDVPEPWDTDDVPEPWDGRSTPLPGSGRKVPASHTQDGEHPSGDGNDQGNVGPGQ